ncbi:MAG: hypothetical protein ABWY21_13190 [Rhodococcus sp. (in: high G+C Gram-positive bacteria)]
MRGNALCAPVGRKRNEVAGGHRGEDDRQKASDLGDEVDRVPVEQPLQLKPIGDGDELRREAASLYCFADATLIDQLLEVSGPGLSLAPIAFDEVGMRGMVGRCRLGGEHAVQLRQFRCVDVSRRDRNELVRRVLADLDVILVT